MELIAFLIAVVVLVVWIMACINIGRMADELGRIAHSLEDFRRVQPSAQPGASPFTKAPPIPSRAP